MKVWCRRCLEKCVVEAITYSNLLLSSGIQTAVPDEAAILDHCTPYHLLLVRKPDFAHPNVGPSIARRGLDRKACL